MTDEESAKGSAGFRLSKLPSSLKADARKLVKELDADGDGAISIEEFATAINSLRDARFTNKNLTKVIIGLLFISALLIASMFGVSSAAARMAKDTNIDDNGTLFNKNSGKNVKMSQATAWSGKINIVDMTASELLDLKQIVLLDGKVNFAVNGYAVTPSGDEVMLLVEGGTVYYDNVGIFYATGNARNLLDIAFGVVDLDGNDISRRLFDNTMLCRRALSIGSIYRKLCGGGHYGYESNESGGGDSDDNNEIITCGGNSCGTTVGLITPPADCGGPGCPCWAYNSYPPLC